MLELKAILELQTLAGLEVGNAFQALGSLIDYADDHAAPDLAQRALGFADQLQAGNLNDERLALLDYFRANAWACLYTKRRDDRGAVWSWDQPELQAQIFHLRRALRSAGFNALHPIRRCQILTNLANQFDAVGRFVEAQEYWTRALAIEPNFWMARGNRGRGLMYYANALYDPGHEGVLAQHAHGDLLGALVAVDGHPEFGDPSVPPMFASAAASIGRAYDLEAIETSYDADSPPLEEAGEAGYRRWCLDHRLFLNPLNDVLARPIAASDVLGLPTFTTSVDEPPIVIGFFNQLKQEFVSARWLYYSGQHAGEPHASDREVLLYNTLDYATYGFAVEQVKLSFRMAYSIFDKIAYFLNRYLKLGIPLTSVSFRSVWRTKNGERVRDLFEASENWPLRGLFWISKDLYEPGVRAVAEPDAEALAELRNHLEHKYVKVHEMGLPRPRENSDRKDPFFDDLAYAITRSDLERKAQRILKLARSALIYLSLGMHREERQRAAKASKDTLKMPMILDVIPDDWKR
jgi:hypothetical protein